MNQRTLKHDRNLARKYENSETRKDSETTAVVREYLFGVMTSLRAQLAVRLKTLRQEFPEHALPCETCAFRTSTDSFEGQDLTIINVIAAQETGSPFYCHKEMPRDDDGWHPHLTADGSLDDSKMQLCAGWAALFMSRDPAKLDVPAKLRRLCAKIAREHRAEVDSQN